MLEGVGQGNGVFTLPAQERLRGHGGQVMLGFACDQPTKLLHPIATGVQGQGHARGYLVAQMSHDCGLRIA
jgi:hypothetical protein